MTSRLQKTDILAGMCWLHFLYQMCSDACATLNFSCTSWACIGSICTQVSFYTRFPLASKLLCRIQKLISKWLFLQSMVCWIHITKWSSVPTHLLLPWEAVLSQLSYAYPAGSFHWKGIRFSSLTHINTWFLQIFTAVHFHIDFFLVLLTPLRQSNFQKQGTACLVSEVSTTS